MACLYLNTSTTGANVHIKTADLFHLFVQHCRISDFYSPIAIYRHAIELFEFAFIILYPVAK